MRAGPRNYSRGTLIAVLALIASGVLAAEELVTLHTRPDVTQTYLLTYEPGRAYQAVAVLLPGGGGHIGLKQDANGISVRSNNFLVRTRAQFAAAGVAAAVMETPSDMTQLSDRMRMGREHLADIAGVVRDLKRRFEGAKVFIAGTSRGSVSAGYAGLALGDQVSGVVLTSAVYNAGRGGAGISGLDFSAYKVPLLLTHHREDACPVCPYSGATRLAKSFPLISVSGGLPPQSGPCEPLSAHGYFGKEAETVSAIAAWMLGNRYATDIP
jgi:hypothetical protein